MTKEERRRKNVRTRMQIIREEQRRTRTPKQETEGKKNRAFAMFSAGYEIKVVSEAVNTNHSTCCEWYGQWLATLKKHRVEYWLPSKKEPYWQNEEEIEKSLYLRYDYEGLSPDEKKIYNESK